MKKEIEEVVDLVILNFIYGAGVVLMAGSLIVFLIGHFKQNPSYMSYASVCGIVGAAVTIVFGIIRRMRKTTNKEQNHKDVQGG